jgi:allantoinase
LLVGPRRADTWSVRLTELFEALFRWAHLIAGIMWIGNSMLFNWLDRNLEKGGQLSRLSQGKIFNPSWDTVGSPVCATGGVRSTGSAGPTTQPRPFKCAPPIRGAANRELLWQALAEGVLDLVASDHSPCTPALKAGDFVSAWGGIAGLQLALPVVWTEASARDHSLVDLARWMSAAPARLAGLAAKGAIAAGRDADLVAFADDEHLAVEPEVIRHRHQTTPYAGETLRGVVHATYLRGARIAEAGRAIAADAGVLL